MTKRNTWITLSVLIAAGLLAMRMGIPTTPGIQQHAQGTDSEPGAAVAPERSPTERPVARRPAVVVPAEESLQVHEEMAPGGKSAGELPKPRPAKHFADVQIPDKEVTPSQQIARIALSFVGMDADAEDVWVAAINDPTMPAEDRKNLIEDLNEDGFVDPDHPTPDELPLIMNRLDLIESLAPDAIDDVNFAAFAEAHKDLLNMYRQLTQ